MCNWKLLLLLVGLLASSAFTTARAQAAQVTDRERVAMADLIVVGTVATAQALDNVPSVFGGEITIKVDRVLKGAAPATLRVRHPIPPQMPTGKMLAQGGLRFDVGSTRLFFLVRFLDRYTVVGGGAGAVRAEDAWKYAELAEHPPVTIKLAELPTPLILGNQIKVHFTVVNHGDKPLVVWSPMLTGYVLGADQRSPVYATAAEDPATPAPTAGYGTVGAGDQQDFTVTLRANGRTESDLPLQGVKWPARLSVFLMPKDGKPGTGWTAQSERRELQLSAQNQPRPIQPLPSPEPAR